ncbi:MAG: phospholipid-lipopolysaccharide transporter [Deltaproteobacteria bacterium]|nr:phospholipid-lipopolysaccharide transporter [Deltaproteobacteria bacterium]
MNSPHLRRVFRYLRPYLWPHFIGGMICMSLFSTTNGIMPFLVKRISDDVFSQKNELVLSVLPFIIIATFIVRGILFFGSAYLSEYVGQRIITDLRRELNDHIQDLSLSFFDRYSTGDIITRMTNDVVAVRGALIDAVTSVLRDAFSLVVLIVVAFWQDWVLALIGFVAFPTAVLPVLQLSRKLRNLSWKGQVSLDHLTTLLQETVQGNRVVKAFGMEPYEKRRFGEENESMFGLTMKVLRIRTLTNPIMEILAAFAIAGVVWYGGHSVISGTRTQGTFLAFLTALFLLYDPFKALGRAHSTIQLGLVSADRVFQFIDEVPEIQDKPEARPLIGIEPGIELENVSFTYGHDLVLRNVNLTIKPGEVVALVGPSGGGKSTLADLILRFYDVAEGAIRIGGIDIRDVTLASLRAQIGLVTQHTFLFNDTVRSNIAYGGIDQNMDAIVAAAKDAYAHDFIMELPQGYDTSIGEFGMRLSGGQRQRIAIARALLKNAPILVLDEATSALDNESERLVQQALDRLMENRTTLVIAHRLSTVRRADRILVLVKGEIVEQGTHEELLALNAEYRKLHDLQFMDEVSPQMLQ